MDCSVHVGVFAVSVLPTFVAQTAPTWGFLYLKILFSYSHTALGHIEPRRYGCFSLVVISDRLASTTSDRLAEGLNPPLAVAK